MMGQEMRDGTALRQLLARHGAGREGHGKVDLEPGCAYGVVTRQMVEGLAADLREIKGRINALFSLVVGAILLEIVFRLAGLG